MALAETAELAIRINLEGNAATGIGRLNKQLGGLSKNVGRAGRGVGQIGAGLARAGLFVGGAAVAGITAAAKAAIDFEDAFAGVRKTVNETELTAAGLSFEQLATDFREMATEIPIAATEFARLGEIAGALGVNAADITRFAEVTAKLGVTTNLTADEAADAFGRIGTILDLTGKEYDELADSLVALGNAGASTESEIIEISKRFAATAAQAGLTKEQILGLASATASLGFEPERGGTALARVFGNIATNVSTANAKGKALSKGLGRSIKSLQSDIDKGKGLDIFMDVLQEIKGLKPTDAARFLDSIGVKNVSDRTIFLAMAEQLPFVNEQLEIATRATGALNQEAQKKFATTASKIQIFKNNLIEAGITLGEQVLPAVGRALDKIIGALKDPGTKTELVQLGKDIGAAIDEIDWAEVVDGAKTLVNVMKGALGFAKTLFDAFNALPGPIKEAGIAFLTLNKLSGGLVGAGLGNIFGGLGEALSKSLLSRIPVLGKAFVQPVFVTNMGAGGLGGGVAGTAGKGLSALSKVFLVGEAIGLALMVEEVRSGIADQNTEFAGAIQTQTAAFLAAQPDKAALETALAGVDRGIADLTSNPLNVLVQGDALTKLQQMRADIAAQLARTPTRSVPGPVKNSGAPANPFARPDRDDAVKKSIDNTTTAVETMRGNIGDSLGKVNNATIEAGVKAKNSNMEIKTQVASSAMINQALLLADMATLRTTSSTTQGAVRGVAPPIVGAIRSSRPVVTTIVNVTATHVTKSTTIQKRYGPGGGSAWMDNNRGENEYG